MHEHGTKTTPVFLPAEGEPLGCYFQVWSLYCQAAQCNQKTPIPQDGRSGLQKPKNY